MGALESRLRLVRFSPGQQRNEFFEAR